MAQTASVRLTLSNIATEEDVNNLREDFESMEERIMSQLSDAVAQIKAAVSNLSVAQSPEKVAELESALQAERDANQALVAAAADVASAEELEDVAQNQALADAKSQVDALLAEMNTAAGELGTITEQLNALGTAVDETPDETPVGEVPVDPAPPVAETPEAPVEEGPTTDVPSSPETPSEGATPDGTPAPEPAPAGGMTDANGNPVEGPNL